MHTHIILSPDAKADIRSVIEWYYRADPNLAFRFDKETLTTLDYIRDFPSRFRIMNGTIRQARLKRFPYAIYYGLKSDLVMVVAVVHQRRSDAIWKLRGRR